jgi:hypothetical protein
MKKNKHEKDLKHPIIYFLAHFLGNAGDVKFDVLMLKCVEQKCPGNFYFHPFSQAKLNN